MKTTDEYLENEVNILISDYELLVYGIVYLSSKFEDKKPITVNEISTYCNFKYIGYDIYHAEMTILKILDFCMPIQYSSFYYIPLTNLFITNETIPDNISITRKVSICLN